MDVITQVFLIFVTAKAAAELFVRIGMPAIGGELLVGVLLGPHVAGVIEVNQSTGTLASLGIVILLFTVGLETPLSGLLRVGRPALLTSLAGIAAALATGTLVVAAFGFDVHQSLLAGAALSATSVGVAARVFKDAGHLSSAPARTVLGAAVVDDVVTLALFPLVLGVGSHGSSVAGILLGVVGVVVFLVLVSAVGSRFAASHPTLLDRPRVRRSPFVLSLALCLGLAALAEQVGLAALVGAFLAGMVLADTRDRYELDRRMLPLFDFLVPFFFVVSAAKMDPRQLTRGGVGLVVALVAVTLLAKFAACAATAVGLDRNGRLQVGAGMVPRNEVTLVVAATAAAAGAIDQRVFSVLVAAVLVSTLVAAPLLRLLIEPRARRRRFAEEPPEAPGHPEEAAEA